MNRLLKYGAATLFGLASYTTPSDSYAQAHRAPLTRPQMLHNTSSAPTRNQDEGWGLDEKIGVGVVALGAISLFGYSTIQAIRFKKNNVSQK